MRLSKFTWPITAHFWKQQNLNGAVVATDRAVSVVFDQSTTGKDHGVLLGLIERVIMQLN